MMLAVLAGMLALADEAPAADWRLIAAPNSCSVQLDGDATSADRVGIRKAPLAEEIELLLPAGRNPGRAAPAAVTTASGQMQQAAYLPLAGDKAFSGVVRIEQSALAQAQDDRFVVTVDKGKPIDVSWPRLSDALTALDACTTGILDCMGYKPGEETPVPAGGWDPPSTEWIRNSDYPKVAVRQHRVGRMLLGWIIGTDGRIRNCTPLVSSGDALLDTSACTALTRRGRYAAPKDRDGRPVEQFASRVIDYRL